VARQLGATNVIDVLADLFIARGVPADIRSDDGSEFTASAVKGWITGIGVRIPGSCCPGFREIVAQASELKLPGIPL
jgi:hypothetical protein